MAQAAARPETSEGPVVKQRQPWGCRAFDLLYSAKLTTVCVSPPRWATPSKPPHLHRRLQVRVIELVHDIPAKGPELAALLHDTVEKAEAERQLLPRSHLADVRK
jgi:hypothetical protein